MIAVGLWASASEAAFFGLPRALKSQLEHISFTTPTLSPMAHARFCMEYHEDCEARSVDFRHRNIQLTQARWEELNTINRAVNREIIPQRNLGGLLTEHWRVAPQAGECHDYAVTKRHELLARGWPARSLLLSEVVVPSGEHHLVLLVRMKHVDLVLDNLSANIRTVDQIPYQWVRVESPRDPKYWSKVSVDHPARIAMAE
jgi:predicted transglutaminase-like cysteine proteinase